MALAAAVLLGACSDDDTATDPKPYVDALAAGLTADGSLFPLDEDKATCIAERWVEIIGTDRLESADGAPEALSGGLADLDLTADEGRTLAGAYGTCDVDVKERLMAGITSDASISDGQRACLDEVLVPDYLDELVGTIIVNGGLTSGDLDPAEQAELIGPLRSCDDPDS